MAKPSKKQKQAGKRSAALKPKKEADTKLKSGKRKDLGSSSGKKKSFSGAKFPPQTKKRLKPGADKSQKTPEKKRKFPAKEETAEGSEPKKSAPNDEQKPADRKAKKEILESRKRKRKPNFDIEKEAVILWEKMRQRDLSPAERSRIVSETLTKMKGKMMMMAMSHTCSRVLQSCVKHCTPAERKEVFDELGPNFLQLAQNTYACHLALRMLDHAKKDQLQQILSRLHGRVVRLLRHPSGSAVIEQAYQLANGTQKQALVSEFFSPEYRLFKKINPSGKNRLVDILSGESSVKRKSVLEHMTLALQPILEKGIVDHSITHRALVEYLSIVPATMVRGIVEQLSGPSIVRMIHTADGAKLGILCVRNGSPKERKKIVKALKGEVMKVAQNDHGYAVLLSIFDVVDDTELVNKIIMTELAKDVKDLTSHKYGHRVALHLLAPNIPRYFPADLLKALQCPIELYSKTDTKNDDDDDGETKDAVEGEDAGPVISKKDPLVRRTELLLKSGFAEKLAEVCAANAGDLLRSPVGKDVIYEVARGGVDGITLKATRQGISSVHKAIAELAALPKGGDEAEEHVLEHFHASRTIRRLVLDGTGTESGNGRSFAEELWQVAIKGRCKIWAQGHSEKVVAAFRDSQDLAVRRFAKSEIDSLVASGLLLDRKPKA